MKRISSLLTMIMLAGICTAYAQQTSEWKSPMHEVQFISESGDDVKMEVDKGYKYANLEFEGRKFHLFYDRDMNQIKKARIVEPETRLEIARGRGSYFWGSARFEFVDGDIVKVKRKRDANGYEITGPSGPLFKVENHAITPVKTYNEKEFMTQAFYVFERIKLTQNSPSDVMIFYSNYYQTSSNK
ncbi:hypothetical protein [Algoriphagus sp.]|uniref:hypothetical protein n=1 Tax=Algoriphagus sp. TaxID=1872435 RepID=UPI003F71690E